MKGKQRARKHKSKIIERIKSGQESLDVARTRKRLLMASKISEALASKDIKRIELAKLLDKYSSEVTRWTSGDHNFTQDTLSDLEEVLGIQLLDVSRNQKPKVAPSLQCTL